MVEVSRGAEPEEFRRAAAHTLFVEGSSDEAIDPEALRLLLKGMPLRIKAMGPSSHIRSVAEALHRHHPDYYFLVDRDHHERHIVEECWRNFPLATTNNLLIWRRRELENYFLIPEYICKSAFLKCSHMELQDQIIREAQRRIFLDAANLIIIGLREELKRKWIEVFSEAHSFDTKEAALNHLLNYNHISQKITDVGNKFHKDEITHRFEAIVLDLFGGKSSLQYAHGSWLEKVSGKAILKTIVNKCYQVKAGRKSLQGQGALRELVKELLRLPLPEQPADFQELYTLMTKQTNNAR